MSQSNYYIDKSTNTFADSLAALGLAYVINAIANGDKLRAEVRIEDEGSAVKVACEPALKPEWVERCPFFVGAPFLITYDRKTEKKAIKGTSLTLKKLSEAGGDTVADYEAEKQNNTAFFDWLKAIPKEERRKALNGSGELKPPATIHPDWDLFRAVNPSALPGYNSLLAEWYRGKEAFGEMLGILLAMTAQTPNAIEGAEDAWEKLCKEKKWEKPKDATAIQLLNPAQGKGTNSSKAIWSAPNNVKSFWMLEWLKLIGLRKGGMTRLIQGAKDRKTYALTPKRLGWEHHNQVMGKFRRAMLGSANAVQMDVLVALNYTSALLKHYEEAREEDFMADFFGKSASDLVSGLQMAFYKDLGNSTATMNIASIALPGWVQPDNQSALSQFQASLDEHIAIIRGLDESRGDQFSLLCNYRDFLSGNDLEPFFRFTTAYSGFIIGQRERRKPVRQFTTTTLEILFMNSDTSQKTYNSIFQSNGFKNIAAAIRHSTVVPQIRKGKGGSLTVDIRYGLGQQLARKSAYPEEFLAELAEFIHLYNAENAQLMEKKRNPFRKMVTTSDLEEVTALIDQFGSKVVCNMLVAYGYARTPSESKADTSESEPEVDADDSGSDDNENGEE